MLEILNEMFDALCMLECVQDEQTQLLLQEEVKKGINCCHKSLEDIDKNLASFDENVYKEIQDISLKRLTANLFKKMVNLIVNSVNAKTEMRDFAIAEYNLVEFCKREKITSPEILFAHKDDVVIDSTVKTYFTPDMIGKNTIQQSERINKNKQMVASIKQAIGDIVKSEEIEFYTQEDQRINRYFYGWPMQKNRNIRSKILAVLDDRTKWDKDLLFTTEGVMPVIKGRCKAVVPYDHISWSNNTKRKELIIGVKYSNDNLDMDKLYELIKELAINESYVEVGFLK